MLTERGRGETMSKEKQIEEMCLIAKKAMVENSDWHCRCDVCCADIIDGIYCDESAVINGLYNAGYRKQSEGEWRPYKTPLDARQTGWICSNCSSVIYDLSNGDTDFCPNCGAMMSGGNKDE
jgi:membrane protease subunit (stomatin/prohibitin family)